MATDINNLPTGKSEVSGFTPEPINAEIERQIEANLNYFKRQDEETIRRRIQHLDQEWDTERVLQLGLASIALTSSVLGLAAGKKWLFVSSAASIFAIQQTVQGWSPPLPLIRKLGIRTPDEINLEKQALLNLLRDDL